jgi:hypothetical protein
MCVYAGIAHFTMPDFLPALDVLEWRFWCIMRYAAAFYLFTYSLAGVFHRGVVGHQQHKERGGKKKEEA